MWNGHLDFPSIDSYVCSCIWTWQKCRDGLDGFILYAFVRLLYTRSFMYVGLSKAIHQLCVLLVILQDMDKCIWFYV